MRVTTLILFAAIAGGAIAAPEIPAGEPTHEDQYMMELIQRCRLDPEGEAARYKIDLNEGLSPGTLGSAPRQPLAFNFEVLSAAHDHNEDLLANFTELPFDHRGSDGRSPTQRVEDTDAVFSGSVFENNAWTTKEGKEVNAKAVHVMHKFLFKDEDIDGRVHRVNFLRAELKELGVSVLGGKFSGDDATICTQDFIVSGPTYIVGVAYDDKKEKDDFYTPGEGLGGVTVTAKSRTNGAEFTTTTWTAGGYNLPVPADTYDVTASGGELGGTVTVTAVVVGTRNIKVDFTPPPPPPPPPPAPEFTLTKATGKLSKKTGLWTLKFTKATFNHGTHSFTRAELDALFVTVNGTDYFTPAMRATAVVKEKVDKKTGEVVKLTIKETDGSKLIVDLAKKKLKIVLKHAATFDPTTGPLNVRLTLDAHVGNIEAVVTITGKTFNKAVMAAAVGTIDDRSGG